MLPFTEEEARKRDELALKYEGDNIGLAIDSIEPEGGPITGETRVLVRGGPFENMSLLYPRPKCKFGSNDRIVEATYVKCTEKPLKVDEYEGKHPNKVSRLRTTHLSLCSNRRPGVSNVTTVPQSPNLKSSPS